MNAYLCIAVPILSRYLIAPLKSIQIRAACSFFACAALIYFGCQGLEAGKMTSILACSLCWMVSIRLFHKIVWKPEEPIVDYLLGYFWFMLPILKNEGKNSWISTLKFVFYHLVLAGIKLVAVNWIYRWLLHCIVEQNVTGPYLKENYFLTLQYVTLFFIMTFGTFENDIQIAVVSLVTKDKYRVLEFNNWPILSKSPREFWGKRYNLLVHTLLKESVFQPLHSRCGLSQTQASLVAFTLSGLLHSHVSYIGFHYSNIVYASVFFILQGLLCAVDRPVFQKLPVPVAQVLTVGLLIATSPLYPAFFVYEGPQWFSTHIPAASEYFTNVMIPNVCPS